jgi:altronate hydrolase
VLNIQDQGGIAKTIEAAEAAVRDLMPAANSWVRSEQPASKLVVALECGGSDGNSGVTANPALGVAADLVVAQGGTAILGETTEIYGAEHLLTRRAVSREVGEKLVERIKWWEWYTGVFGAEINNNPSPGNKAGGLTTIYEKSLGALAKAGTTALVDVIPYAAKVETPGLVFMDTPGYDPPCTTGLVASGANVLVFTTGRGSVLGLRPTPCIKVATNTPIFERMADDMDLDAGPVLEGESLDSAGRRLFDLILSVADGEETKSERLGVGEEEFAPWQIGPTL